MNSDDKIIYESAKEVIEAIISEIRAAKLDPISLGFPYYTQQHLDTILNTVDVDDYLIHFAMRILEERDWRDKERA